MNKKLIPAAFLAAFGFAACDGNDENPTDTIRPDTTDTTSPGDTTDTSQPDGTTPPVDTITPPDVVAPSATVKYARTLVAQQACTGDFRNDIDPQSQLSGVIVTTPVYTVSAATDDNPARYGFYVADADGGAFSGILVITDEPKPELVPGNVVDVSGQLMEAFCNAQVSNATVTKKSEGTSPQPLVQSAVDLAQDAYEGLLVRINDITVAPGPSGGKQVVSTNLFIGFVFPGFIAFTDGSTYDITGVIRSTRFNGVEGFQIVPRGPSDVVLKSAAANSIVGIQSAAISMTCPAPAPQFQNGLSGIQLEGTIAVGKFSLTATLDGYYITDGSQNPYSGVIVNIAKSPATDFQVGDQVRVVGDHQEFFCNTQLRTSTITKIGGPLDLPAAVVLDKSTSLADLEQWEGMLVEMNNVVAGTFETTGVFAVATDANLKIDDGIIGRDGFASGAAITGKPLTTLRGFLRYSRDSYRISPRSAADWVIAP